VLLYRLKVARGSPRLLLTKLKTDGAFRSARRTPPRRLWIGDSQAAVLSGAPERRLFALTPTGDAVVWLGPRPMFRIARDGLLDPMIPKLRREVDLAAAPIILTAGGGDCRRHLVERLRNGGSLDFVAQYVERAAELRVRLGAPHVFLVGPMPPTDPELVNEEYARNGTLAERIAVTKQLESELCQAVARRGDPAISVFPLGGVLGDPMTGELARQFINDGIHPNARGSQRVREELALAEAAVLLTKALADWPADRG